MGSEASYKFKPKHRWQVKNNLLIGITLPAWLKFLFRYGIPGIEITTYCPRIFFITLASLFNSIVALVETFFFAAKIRAQRLHPEPVFVLGHPRTGTTHLHNLLSQDPRFITANIFQVGFASVFLCLERFAWLLSWALDSRRPMDNMPLSFTTPGEDEIAVNALTGGTSPYAALTFMPRYPQALRYCTFERCSQAEVGEWCAAFMWFLRKVTLAAGGDHPKPLVIKSPVHCGRIPLLLKLFPAAKFVFVHRDPLEVFQSCAHMADTYNWYCCMQQPCDEDITDYIFDQHKLLYDSYLKHRHTIPSGNLVEVSFAELDGDPMGTMQRVYQRFNWPDFASAAAALKGYLAQIEGFKKNDHQTLSVALRARLERECAPVFQAFGYRQSTG